MGSDVTVIVPSLPERAGMLAQVLADLAAQTHQPVETRVGIDYQHRGPAKVRNWLALGVRTTWLAFVDDDDRIDPDHLAILVDNSRDADVVWSMCRVTGEPQGWTPTHLCPPERGEMPVTSLVRTEAFLEVGGFPDLKNEDEALFTVLMAAGATFTCVHAQTWTYQFHDSNRSRSHLNL